MTKYLEHNSLSFTGLKQPEPDFDLLPLPRTEINNESVEPQLNSLHDVHLFWWIPSKKGGKKTTTNEAIERKAKTGQCKKYCDVLSMCENLMESNLLKY
jgi:hypothetical protein